MLEDPVDPPGTDVALATNAYKRRRYALEFPRGGCPTFLPGQSRHMSFENDWCQEIKSALSDQVQFAELRSCNLVRITYVIVDPETA